MKTLSTSHAVKAINNATANRVTTIASSTDQLDAEANLTFDGSTLATVNLDISGDVDIDGTLEADAITLDSTSISSLFSPIAGSSSIVTVGTIGTGVWQGTAIENAYIAGLPTSKITSGTFSDGRIAASNVTQHQASITGTGALNSGSISSGFGAIDTGSSSITTTGALAVGSATVSGTTDGEKVALILKNEDDGNDADGAVSIQFDLEDTGGTAVDSGKIRIKKREAFTATASTQDSRMDFYVSENGTLNRQASFMGNREFRFHNSNSSITVDSVSGTDTAGKNLTISAGAGTGTGVGGSLIFQTADGGAQSNSNVNSQATALTIADNLQATFAGAIQANSTITVADGSLVLGSTALTSTATELNLLDNVSGLVQADFTKLAAIDASAAEIDLLDGDTSVGGSITIADTDGFIVNDGGTMKTIPASDLKTYAGGGGGGSAADDSNLVLHMQVFA